MAGSRDKASAKNLAQEAQQPAAASTSEAGQTEEWVFTIVSATGEIAKVEKIDKTSGRRKELSQEEYAALSGYMDPSAYAYDPSGYGQSAGTGEGYATYEAGYYQGLKDYETALAQQSEAAVASMGYGHSPQQHAAYIQGMVDYEALLG